MTLDDPPPLDARFLGFHLQPVAELTTASHSSFMEEIVRQSGRGCRQRGTVGEHVGNVRGV
jgi:hypothetical protein